VYFLRCERRKFFGLVITERFVVNELLNSAKSRLPLRLLNSFDICDSCEKATLLAKDIRLPRYLVHNELFTY
jgi:hypothetical protein